jgi:hypothetical protein
VVDYDCERFFFGFNQQEVDPVVAFAGIRYRSLVLRITRGNTNGLLPFKSDINIECLRMWLTIIQNANKQN